MVDDMNGLQVFSNPQFGEIRFAVIDGMTWAVGKDVAKSLGYKDTVNAIKAHVDPEDKRGWQITTPSGDQTMAIINESGLYSLILSSKLPAARAFKRWVTSEVLPTIRRTGGYGAQSAENRSEETIRLMRELMDARAENAALRLKIAQEEITELRARLREAETDTATQQTAQDRKREANRIRQQRFRERQKQAAAQGDTQM